MGSRITRLNPVPGSLRRIGGPLERGATNCYRLGGHHAGGRDDGRIVFSTVEPCAL